MLLIRKFYDYYDTCVGYGVDKNIVYNRETKYINIDLHKNFPNLKNIMKTNFLFEFKWKYYNLLSFCGEIYPFICFNKYSFDIIKHTFYDIEHLNKIDSNDYFNYGTKKEYINSIANTFDEIKNSIDTINLHHKTKSPILLIGGESLQDETNVIVNPCLKTYNFQKIKDPYTAFQDISMFISGVLGNNEINVVNISDKDLRDSKGFDNMSFKKLPEIKK